MQLTWRLAAFAAVSGLLLEASIGPQAVAAVPRSAGAVGTIITADGDDQIRFVADPTWQLATVQQQLLAGDLLQTGPQGLLALRFIDQTMIRVQHDSQLLVKAVPPGGTAQLQLQEGGIWARAATGGTGVDVETPAATAAIRGTDWSLTVAKGKTTLMVMAGTVILRNAQGSVSVSAGEAAVAAIGQAPSKIVVAAPPGKEQFLFHISTRTAFQIWPVDDLLPAEERAAAAAIKAKAPEARSNEDLVTGAELALRLDGSDAARDAVALARRRPDLTTGQIARLDLVQAMLDGRHRQWKQAAAGFAKAAPGLSGMRLYAATFCEYVALTLDHRPGEAKEAYQRLVTIPAASLKEPIYTEMAQAWIEAIGGEIPKALERVKAIQGANPKDPRLPLFAAQLSILLGRDKEAQGFIEKAMAIDPDDGEVLNIFGTMQRDYTWDIDGAERTLRYASRQQPGNADVWNTYGLILQDQGDARGAAMAFEKAMALDPDDPVAPANYAILLLDNNQLDAAEKQFNQALTLDPSFYAALLAKGRWQIQRGELAEAKNTFLDSVAADPSVSESTQGLAIAYYEAGDVKRAQQQLNAAERLDPNDPLVPLIRTVIALDESEADTALINARESFKRYRARGGVYDALAQSRTDGSYLNAAFNKLSLGDWSRYYGDLLYSPFNASSLFYEATAL
jgi:Tfp pilus assembly protein PilF